MLSALVPFPAPIVAQMRTHARVAAAVLTVLGFAGLIVGCTQTTPGTVAMTTEPAPTTTTRTPSLPTLPNLPTLPSLPGFPLPTRDTSVPSVPAPPNALTMTCGDYAKLDEATQLAVVDAILQEGRSPLGAVGADIAKSIADSACQFVPGMTVSEVLTAGNP